MPRLFLVMILALMGGWAGFSGTMALVWFYFPNTKELVASSPDHHLFFFPPLFGSSPLLYMIAAYSIVGACCLTVFFLRAKTRESQDS